MKSLQLRTSWFPFWLHSEQTFCVVCLSSHFPSPHPLCEWCPPCVCTCFCEDLWSHVGGGATHGVDVLLYLHGQTKVSQLQADCSRLTATYLTHTQWTRTNQVRQLVAILKRLWWVVNDFFLTCAMLMSFCMLMSANRYSVTVLHTFPMFYYKCQGKICCWTWTMFNITVLSHMCN